ncbi:DUF4270 family protein [Pseudochryseolinea flava]|uniref:DUF4270 domain-containing protein n=1 Tax=Pseudochryseolinea flava TaxID=2059302 RepID=A0A364Y084_9BACT|nr:DUF4270 family protein [Pseudochryseolinea flava]RAW00008.1 hypothetical protein DQQ10_15735 [Pseudochryseolinea flava]
MRKICVVLVFALLSSCMNDASEIGADFFNEGALDVAMIDSATVKLSTIQFEALATNSASRMLLGSHVDEKLGRISATVFFQAGITSDINFKDEPYAFSHAALVFYYDGYSYYDTTQTITLNAFQVAEPITLDDNGIIKNSDRFDVDETRLGSLTLIPKPHRSDSLEIPIASWFGNTLFQKAMIGDEDLQTNADFIKYLHGICVMPDTTQSGPILGFTASPELRLYYYDKSVTPSQLSYIAFKANSTYSFTSIQSDRTNTLLTNLPDERGRLDASLTADQSYIQSGSGLALRVDMPYLRTLAQNENFFVTTAILEVFPVRKSFDEQTNIPGTLFAYPINKRNEITSDVYYTSTLRRDTDLGRNTYYQVDVTQYVKTQIALAEFNENALLFIPSGDDYNVGVNRIYFSNPNSEYNTRLKIYYATINR